jgi:hypothetical protein
MAVFYCQNNDMIKESSEQNEQLMLLLLSADRTLFMLGDILCINEH